MDLGLTGRVAIVAAASKGLGRSVAEELAREGASVAICARTPATLSETAIDQLLMSTVNFAREVLPRMQKNKWGRLITITSSAVKQPVDGLLLSNSIRAAVTGLARTLANEYAADGITVNNVCPGFTRTARLDNLASAISKRTGAKPQEVFAGWERETPAGRVGTPEEFAAVVAFLASVRASYVNGTSIAVDGGLVRSLL